MWMTSLHSYLFVHVLVYISLSLLEEKFLRAVTLSVLIMEQKLVYSRCSINISCMNTRICFIFLFFPPFAPHFSVFLCVSLFLCHYLTQKEYKYVFVYMQMTLCPQCYRNHYMSVYFILPYTSKTVARYFMNES